MTELCENLLYILYVEVLALKACSSWYSASAALWAVAFLQLQRGEHAGQLAVPCTPSAPALFVTFANQDSIFFIGIYHCPEVDSRAFTRRD